VIPNGTVIEGRYRVDRVVGSGGFGTVHAGCQLAIDLPIAIKVLRIGDEVSASKRAYMLSHFVEEARILGRLRHECVVRTIDQGILMDGPSGATPYLIMEWGGDETLRDLLSSLQRALPLPVAWPLIHGMVEGVAHAHALGIAHRDLKPSNVMLANAADGRVTPRVIDFGIAKLFEETDLAGSGSTRTRSAPSPFTPAYAAPEQIASARTGPWTDVHALALVFVEMVTGRPPYGDDGSQGLVAIDPTRPTPKRFGVDVGAFEPVLAAALALRPAERYRDAGQFLAALDAAAAAMGFTEVVSAMVFVPRGQLERSGEAYGNATGAPVSNTIRVERTPPLVDRAAPFALTEQPKPASRRALLIAAGALGSSAVLGAGVWAAVALTFGEQRRKSEAPRDDAESAANSARVATSNTTLASLTIEELDARATKLGLTIANRTALGNPKQFLLSFQVDNVWGTIHLIEFGSPSDKLVGAALDAELLPYLGSIVRNYRDSVQPGIAYGYSDRTVLLVAWQADPRVITWFDGLVTGFELTLRGNTITGPDPATHAAPARFEAPLAKGIAELTPDELRNRLIKAGALELAAMSSGSPVWFNFSFADVRGQKQKVDIKLFPAPPVSAPGSADAYLASLTRAKKPHAVARDGAALVVCEGPPGFDSAALLKLVLVSLNASVKSL